MIRLFNPPSIDCIRGMEFSNLLHDPIVRQFEEKFSEYVGARYAVSFNSATNAITTLYYYLITNYLLKKKVIEVPTMIPNVVPNALTAGIYLSNDQGYNLRFVDNPNWVGGPYPLCYQDNLVVIDSAQEVRPNIFSSINTTDVYIYSLYPTKPVGSCDGGVIACNNKELADELRILSFNGTTSQANSWERRIVSLGFKNYMNSIQAAMALKSLEWFPKRKEKLTEIREKYNTAFGLQNQSDHLYRIEVANNERFIDAARRHHIGIECGIHYRCIHQTKVFNSSERHAQSEKLALQTVSIPFHDGLHPMQVQTVIDFVNQYKDKE